MITHMTETKTWRQINMEKATAARMQAAEERKARELIERGWFCARTGFETWLLKAERDGQQVYATDELNTTFRVIGWEHEGGATFPTLDTGNGNSCTGRKNYLFTAGPA